MLHTRQVVDDKNVVSTYVVVARKDYPHGIATSLLRTMRRAQPTMPFVITARSVDVYHNGRHG